MEMKREMNLARRLQVLAACPVLSGAPPEDLRLLAEMALCVRPARGEILFSAGDLADGVYVVASGRLGVLPAGEPEPTRMLGPVELLGEYGMAIDAVRTATVRAEEDSELLFVDYFRFRAYLLRCPESLFLLFQTAARRLFDLEHTRMAGET